MKKRFVFLVLSLIFLSATFTGIEQLKIFPDNFKWPVVLDSAYTPGAKRIEKHPQTANYLARYIGKNADTVYLEKSFLKRGNWPLLGLSKYGNSDSLIIHVDTSKVISEYARSTDAQAKEAALMAYEAYRVIIVNPQQDTVYICRGSHIPMKMEALNKENEWKVIEYPFIYFCGTGLAGIYLPGNEILITAAPKYTGTIKTKLRVRYKNCVSNEFYGSLNPEQFQVESDSIRMEKYLNRK